MIKHYTATYPSAAQAKKFAANAERVIHGADNVARVGKVVGFDAEAIDPAGYSTYADVALSVGYYGGPGTKLNGNSVPREM